MFVRTVKVMPIGQISCQANVSSDCVQEMGRAANPLALLQGQRCKSRSTPLLALLMLTMLLGTLLSAGVAQAQKTIITPPNSGGDSNSPSGTTYSWTVPSPAPGATVGGYMMLNASANDCCSTATITVAQGGSAVTTNGTFSYSRAFWANAGATYTITVTTDSGISENLGWTFNPSPVNDNFANAINLSAAPYDVNGDAIDFNGSYETLEAGDPMTSADEWFKWTAPAAGQVTFSSNGRGGDGQPPFLVFTGADLTHLTNPPGAPTTPSGNAQFTVAGGTTYYIAVNGTGNDTLTWSFTPSQTNATLSVTVPGTSDPWLAGMPNGSGASSGDTAPAESPVQVNLTAGGTLTFTASGSVDYGGASGPPDGITGAPTAHANGAENGISGVTSPADSLVGVFLGPAQPDGSAAPADLDFSTGTSQDYTTLAPQLKQVFFIGDGKTSGGTTQQITIPSGATRLFLGTMDGSGWYNNSGSFSVRVTGPVVAPVGNSYTFTGNAAVQSNCNPNPGDGGDWDDPRNWAGACGAAGPPGANDTATIGSNFGVHTNGAKTVDTINLFGGLALKGDLTVSQLNFNGASIGGSGGGTVPTVIITGTLNWSKGSFSDSYNGGSDLNLTAGSTAILTGDSTPGAAQLVGHILNNGTLIWRGPGIFGFVLDNFGTFDLQADGTFSPSSATGFGGNAFVNHSGATIKKTAGAGSVTFGATQLHNHGTIDVESGTIVLANDANYLGLGSSLLPGSVVTGAGILEWDQSSEAGPDNQWNGTVTVNGTLQLGNSTGGPGISLSDQLTFTGNGQFAWMGGGFIGAGLTFDKSFTVNVSGSGGKSWNGGNQTDAFINNGTLNWKGGQPLSTGGSLTNNSTFNVQANGNFFNGALVNNGTLNTFAGIPSTDNSVVSLVGALTNNGTVNLGGAGTIGTLSIDGGQNAFTQTSTGVLNMDIGGTSAGQFDQLLGISDPNTGTNLNLGGTLNVNLVNGYTPTNSDSFAVVYAQSDRAGINGQFANLNGPFDAIYDLPRDVTLTTLTTPTIASFTPAAGPVGTTITISGTDLNRVTGVSFNGVAATQFSFNPQTNKLTVTVPTGATTGKIKLTTSSGDPNDFGVSSTDFVVSAITVSVNPSTFSESAGANAATGTVTLNAAIGSDVTIAIASDNTNLVTVNPGSVTIPAGQTTASFAVGAVDNAVAGANPPVHITATAQNVNINPSSTTVTVTDNDSPGITVTPTSGLKTSENGQTATFTIKLNSQPTADVTIGLSSSNTKEGTVAPASVTFNANNWNVAQTVTVTGVPDGLADGDQNYTILTAPAVSNDPNYNKLDAADVSVTNVNIDVPTLTLTLNDSTSYPLQVTEGATITGKVTCNVPHTGNLVVALSSSTPDATINVPASVTLPGGQTSATFTIATTDDSLAQGTRNTTITAKTQDGTLSDAKALAVLDNDTPQLSLTLGAAQLVGSKNLRAQEGVPVTGTLTRNTIGAATVTLSSSNPAVPVPTTATFAAGQLTTTFTIETTDDQVAQDDRTTTITATSQSLSDSAILTVVDNDVPTLSLKLAQTTISETGSTVATLTRNTPNDQPLEVSLSIANTVTGQVAPAKFTDNDGNAITSITIPAGSDSVTFKVVGVDDGVVTTANKTGTISAQATTATGTLTATPVTITVTNSDVAPPPIPAPTISSFSPTSGPVGSLVTINGANLDGATVKFGTVVATVSAALSSATQLVVTVPTGVKVGSTMVAVTTPSGSASKAFTVTAPTKTFSISGSVLQGTKPVAGAKVLLIPVAGKLDLPTIQGIVLNVLRAPTLVTQVAVDAHGNYSFEGLAPGSYLVAPYKPGTAFTTTPYRTGASLVPYKVITVTAARIGDVLGVNFLAQKVDSVKPVVTVVNPGGKAVFTPTSVPTATGVATDAESGVLGVGVVLAQVNSVSLSGLKVSFYNWVTSRFDAPVTLTLSSNPLSFLKPEEIKVAPLTGTPAKSTWSLALPHTLNAGSYRVIPLAVDKALNLGYPSILTSQGNFTVSSANSTAQAPAKSPVQLSTGTVSVAKGSVTLRFIGGLDADTASDAAHYTVAVNGDAVPVESAGYDATNHSITLSLPEGALQNGDRVVVTWQGLLDEQGRSLDAQVGPLVAR